MIELRWLKVEIGRINEGMGDTVHYDKVLQYRTADEFLTGARVIWTDWQDVPEVSDD